MTRSDTDVVVRYTKLAFAYDVWSWLTERKSLRTALDRAAVRDGEAVLEVAVGTGVLFREILRRNPSGRNAGVDLTEAMLRRARRKAERSRIRPELVVGDARRLCFEDASFDLVMHNNMLGLVPDHDVAPILAEMRRVLRPDGRLVIVTMSRPEHRVARRFYQLGACQVGKWADIDVAKFLLPVGFELTSREVVSQLGFPSDVLVARPTRTTTRVIARSPADEGGVPPLAAAATADDDTRPLRRPAGRPDPG